MLGPTQNLGLIGLAVLTFMGTNKQTNRQTDKLNLHIEVHFYVPGATRICPGGLKLFHFPGGPQLRWTLNSNKM